MIKKLILTKTNLFYDSLYGNFRVKDLIDLYAIYFVISPHFTIVKIFTKDILILKI